MQRLREQGVQVTPGVAGSRRRPVRRGCRRSRRCEPVVQLGGRVEVRAVGVDGDVGNGREHQRPAGAQRLRGGRVEGAAEQQRAAGVQPAQRVLAARGGPGPAGASRPSTWRRRRAARRASRGSPSRRCDATASSRRHPARAAHAPDGGSTAWCALLLSVGCACELRASRQRCMHAFSLCWCGCSGRSATAVSTASAGGCDGSSATPRSWSRCAAGSRWCCRWGTATGSRCSTPGTTTSPEVEIALDRLVTPDAYFLDCGANTGYWSLMYQRPRPLRGRGRGQPRDVRPARGERAAERRPGAARARCAVARGRRAPHDPFPPRRARGQLTGRDRDRALRLGGLDRSPTSSRSPWPP